MEDRKFTPGPWCVFSKSYTSGRVTRQDIHYGINAYGDGPKGSICQVDSENPADGNLIAASPDLYEALLEARVYVKQAWFRAGDNNCGENATLEKIDAAIRKVKGQT